jgi:hypothetical protein
MKPGCMLLKACQVDLEGAQVGAPLAPDTATDRPLRPLATLRGNLSKSYGVKPKLQSTVAMEICIQRKSVVVL